MADAPPASVRFTSEDRSLIRRIGSHLMQIIQGQAAAPLEVTRQDELGVLAAMVDRAAEMLSRAREKDRRQRAQILARLAELEEAHATQARLLETIRALSLPILSVRRDVLLVPIVGGLDAARAEDVLPRLLERVAAASARAVILDVTGATALDDAVAARLLDAARAVRLLGAEVFICGLSPAVAHAAVRHGLELGELHPRRDLEAALQAAFALVGPRAPRGPRA